MAHSLSAKKRVRQNLKRRARNRARKTEIRDITKGFLVTLGKEPAKAGGELVKVVRLLDRAALKGTIHRNTASRKRSRLQKRLNAAGKGTPAATA